MHYCAEVLSLFAPPAVKRHVLCRNSCSLFSSCPFFFFVIASWSEGCLTCIRWFCPFTLYQNKSPGPSIHKCCCYGYNLDRSVCLTCYELQQFSDPVVPKSSQHSLHKCFSSCRERKFTSISRQKVTKDIFHGL